MADPNKYRLDEDVFEELYRLILLDYLGQCSSLESAQIGVIVAQTGAGKSTLFTILNNQFKPEEVPAHIDMDKLRDRNTNLPIVIISHPFETAFYTNNDAWAMTSRLLNDARSLHCNVIYETTLNSVDGVTETLKSYKDAGYEINLHTLAINSKHSIFGVFARYESALQKKEPARFVEVTYHDLTKDRLPLHVDLLENSGLLNSSTVWRRAGRELCERIYKNDGTYPDLSAKEAIEKEHDRHWTAEEKKDYLKGWKKLVKQIKSRPDGPTKPDWYITAAEHFLNEARLFSKAEQAADTLPLNKDKIVEVTHHHIFTRDEGCKLVCFDRQKHNAAIVPDRGKVYAPPKAKPALVVR